MEFYDIILLENRNAATVNEDGDQGSIGDSNLRRRRRRRKKRGIVLDCPSFSPIIFLKQFFKSNSFLLHFYIKYPVDCQKLENY